MKVFKYNFYARHVSFSLTTATTTTIIVSVSVLITTFTTAL